MTTPCLFWQSTGQNTLLLSFIVVPPFFFPVYKKHSSDGWLPVPVQTLDACPANFGCCLCRKTQLSSFICTQVTPFLLPMCLNPTDFYNALQMSEPLWSWQQNRDGKPVKRQWTKSLPLLEFVNTSLPRSLVLAYSDLEFWGFLCCGLNCNLKMFQLSSCIVRHPMVPQPQKGLLIWFHPVIDCDVSDAAGCGHVMGSNIIYNRKTNVKREILLSQN